MKKSPSGILVPSTYQPNLYTTGKGKQLRLLPLPQYEMQNYRLSFVEQYEAEHPRPEAPTYEIETAGGGKELHEHDAKSAVTDEDKAALAAYEEYGTALDNYVSLKILEVMIIEGVDMNPLDDVAWLKRKKRFGVKLPEDELDLKLMYVQEQLVIDEETGGDFLGLPEALAKLSGISSKAVAAGKATFRRRIRQRQNTAGQPEAEIDGEMVDEPEISGDEDGESVESDTEPVGQSDRE